ncbi:unnamed protein product [Litomosoides sigmodontis]|uniref:C-type lectin domain-containing protein n=1 Tax=Litomosoides sigmodontis TaxID=42156 RepID=A0A3P6TH17_LITSI|nr:unnamed protein product [Litomosoides sigmodontis]
MYNILATCSLLLSAVAKTSGKNEDMVCFDGTLDWRQEMSKSGSPCFGITRVKLAMNWEKANDYCHEIGGQLPTPSVDEAQLLRSLLVETGVSLDTKLPLGFINENNTWMQIRGGEKQQPGISLPNTSMEVLQGSHTKDKFSYEPAEKKNMYKTVVCEHRNSALSVITNQECDDDEYVLLAINNASKCYSFHEFNDPSVEGSDFNSVSSYCKSQNAELFEPIDLGDLHIMKKIGEATGFAVSSAKHIPKQRGYINHTVANAGEEPTTAAGYKYAIVGINITPLNSSEALCFMLELPGGSIVQSTCETKSDFALCVKNSQPATDRIQDILGVDSVIISDLKREVTLEEADDLSYLGVAPEVKLAVTAFSATSILLRHIALLIVFLIIL